MVNKSFTEKAPEILPEPDKFSYTHFISTDDIDVSKYAGQTIKLQVNILRKSNHTDGIMNGQISSTGKTISANLSDSEFYEDRQWRLDTEQILQNESEIRHPFVIKLYSPYSWASSYENANRFRDDIYEEIIDKFQNKSELRQMTHLHYDMNIFDYMKEVVAEKDTEKVVSSTI